MFIFCIVFAFAFESKFDFFDRYLIAWLLSKVTQNEQPNENQRALLGRKATKASQVSRRKFEIRFDAKLNQLCYNIFILQFRLKTWPLNRRDQLELFDADRRSAARFAWQRESLRGQIAKDRHRHLTIDPAGSRRFKRATQGTGAFLGIYQSSTANHVSVSLQKTLNIPDAPMMSMAAAPAAGQAAQAKEEVRQRILLWSDSLSKFCFRAGWRARDRQVRLHCEDGQIRADEEGRADQRDQRTHRRNEFGAGTFFQHRNLFCLP